MIVRVKLFGPLAAPGRPEAAVDTGQAAATCQEVGRLLAQADPRLADLLSNCRIAVNGRYAAGDQVIQPGDEVALIGLVSGG